MQSDQNSNDSLTAMIEEVFAFGKKRLSAVTKPESLYAQQIEDGRRTCCND